MIRLFLIEGKVARPEVGADGEESGGAMAIAWKIAADFVK